MFESLHNLVVETASSLQVAISRQGLPSINCHTTSTSMSKDDPGTTSTNVTSSSMSKDELGTTSTNATSSAASGNMYLTSFDRSRADNASVRTTATSVSIRSIVLSLNLVNELFH